MRRSRVDVGLASTTHHAVVLLPSEEMETYMGFSDLNVSELEQQGYNVITVSPQEWQAMRLAETGEKRKFFRERFERAAKEYGNLHDGDER